MEENLSIKYWKIKDINKNNSIEIQAKCGLSALASNVMSARGFDGESALKLKNLPGLDAYPQLIDIDKAVSRIRQAIESEEPIAVYGDYDCDGITSTALMYSYLESEGADISYYIPDRDTEGYGLNKKAITTLHKSNIKLIITVDNGISAIEEIDYASTLGIDVIVTDHHKPRDILPSAVAVVNPHRQDCPSGLTCLCGVGVVFALVSALEGGDYEVILENYGDIIAIGTVADVMKLTGINRTIVQKGVELIQSEHRTGIRKLLEICSVSPENIQADNLGFTIVPRINAAGRVGDVESSLCLLLTEDDEQAEHLSAELEEYNKKRKEFENKIITDISFIIKNNPNIVEDRVIVIDGTGWHHGVIGIVCAKISDRYGKPCILISCDGEESRGSGRSVEGFSIINAVNHVKDILTRYGGHELAAGLSLPTTSIGKFRKLINDYARESHRIMPSPCINIDCVVSPEEISIDAIKSLGELAPFGSGNPYPVFMLDGVTIIGIQPLSAGKHLKLKLSHTHGELYALYFNMSMERFPYTLNTKVDISFTADINLFNNNESVSIKINSIRPHGINQDELCKDRGIYQLYKNKEPLEEFLHHITPTREDSGIIYRKIKEFVEYSYDKESFYLFSGIDMGYCKFLIALDIMEELMLISLDGVIKPLPVKEKKDFSSSLVLKSLCV